jgi:hypothetical protein
MHGDVQKAGSQPDQYLSKHLHVLRSSSIPLISTQSVEVFKSPEPVDERRGAWNSPEVAVLPFIEEAPGRTKTMSKKSSLMPRALAVSLTVISVLGSVAWAQQPPPVRIRGTIESVDGAVLMIKSREGADMKVRVTDNVAVFGVAKTDLSEIKQGSYIGVTAMPEPDGTQKAVAVHIFPENQRGAAEGFRPWDQRPGSTMTNATVAETVKGTDGQNILVKYKDGEKKVVVPPGTPVVTFVAGEKSELKPGAKIIIFAAVKKDDGMLEAARVNVGRDGVTPPM